MLGLKYESIISTQKESYFATDQKKYEQKSFCFIMHLILSLLHGSFVRSRRSSLTNRNVYLDLSTTHSFVHGKDDAGNIDSFFVTLFRKMWLFILLPLVSVVIVVVLDFLCLLKFCL